MLPSHPLARQVGDQRHIIVRAKHRVVRDAPSAGMHYKAAAASYVDNATLRADALQDKLRRMLGQEPPRRQPPRVASQRRHR